MKIKKALSKFVIGAALCTAAMPAFAQWAVFDPTNFIQNYSQALSGIKNEVNSAKSLIQETQSAINMAKSVKGLKNMDAVAAVKESLRLYTDLKDVDRNLANYVSQGEALTERLTSKYGASEMSWGEFLQSKDQRAKQQRDLAAQRYRTINASIDQTARQRQAIVSQLGAVQGQTEAMQTVGASIDVLIGQNQQMISQMAVTEQLKIEAAKDEKRNDAAAIRQANEAQRRLAQAAAKYNQ